MEEIKLYGKMKMPRWSADEDARLRQMHEGEGKSAAQCAEALGRTRHAVRSRIASLGLRNPKDAWSADELERLRRMYGRESAHELARRLGRSAQAVYVMANRMGLSQRQGEKLRIKLEPWQRETLMREFPHVATDVLASILGMSRSTVVRRARELGLRKTAQFMAESQRHTAAKARESHLLNGTYPPKGVVNANLAKGEAHRFKKGHASCGRRGRASGNGIGRQGRALGNGQ